MPSRRYVVLLLILVCSGCARQPPGPCTLVPDPSASATTARKSSGIGSTPAIVVNDNRRCAGTLERGELKLQLVAQRGVWHPLADNGPTLTVDAFAEADGAPSSPGPLIRVPVGTRVIAHVRNALPDTMFLHGLSPGDDRKRDSVRVAPGQQAEVIFTAARAGTYIYRGATLHAGRLQRWGNGSQLVGAIVVDTPNAPPDRV